MLRSAGTVCAYGQNQLGGTHKSRRCASEGIGDGQVMRPRMVRKQAGAEGGWTRDRDQATGERRGKEDDRLPLYVCENRMHDLQAGAQHKVKD